jgi:hypothetical protein
VQREREAHRASDPRVEKSNRFLLHVLLLTFSGYTIDTAHEVPFGVSATVALPDDLMALRL